MNTPPKPNRASTVANRSSGSLNVPGKANGWDCR